MKTIRLTRGQVALVDDEDFEWLSQWNWYASRHHAGGFYAVRNARDGEKRKTVLMHREILKPATKEKTDHINLNKLDNQKNNLRSATAANNGANGPKPSHNTSGFKGASWHSGCRKWQANLTLNGKRYYLGVHASAEEAAKAYDAAAKILFGEFAKLNFPA